MDHNRKEPAMLKRREIMVVIALLLLVIPASAIANNLTVTKVLSGDVVQFGDFTARLTGIKALPKDHKLGIGVYNYTKSELEGKIVKVFTWTTDNTAAGIVYDEEGRAFVQIYYGNDMDKSFNEHLLEMGYAEVDEEYLPEDLKERYYEIQKKARAKEIGIWSKGGGTPVKKEKAD
jgi:endonuclease YncB( thermonuclease family)